jgi:lambda family phage portal protein
MTMPIADKIGNLFDVAVALISPERGLKRHLRREQLKSARSGNLYAAAKTTKSTGPWSPVNSNVNLIIAASASTVRARVRQLVRDFPYFARAVNVVCDYSVGEGIQFQSRVVDKKGELNLPAIQSIEDAFSYWADEADFSGRLHFYEMMRLAKRQDVEPGEFLLIRRNDPDRKAYLPFKLQMIESDWLTDHGARVVGKASDVEIDQGVEFETASGRVRAYHFSDPDSYGGTVRIDVNDVLHGFETMRPGQRRGISPFAPGVLVADDLASLMDAEIDASKMASKWLAMVTTPDPMSRQMAAGTTVGASGEKIEELENAIIEYLRPGETVELTGNPRPGSNFTPFVRLILCMFSVTTGVPYELISGDYKGMNYSTGKMVRNDFRQMLRPISSRHIRQFCSPIFRTFFDYAVVNGKISAPGYFKNSAPWVRCEWQPPGMDSQDPLRESKANIDEVGARLKSPQEIIKARGRDPETVVKEIAAFGKLMEKYKVTPVEVSTALANNPSAVAGQKSGSDGRYSMTEIMDTLESIMEGIEK